MTTFATRAVAIDSRVSLPSLSPARNRARRRSRGPIALRASGTSDGPPPVVRVAVLCGGPTLERGISLNSARSILDHLRAPGVDVECYYLDQGLRAFPISVRQMYSNTPSDFDFKLRGADADADADAFSDPRALAAHLRARGVIAFTALHVAFGEDGVLQVILVDAGVPVGRHRRRRRAPRLRQARVRARVGPTAPPDPRLHAARIPRIRRHANCARVGVVHVSGTRRR